jgi:hypothetical protein
MSASPYTDEWARSRPDLVVYIPRGAKGHDAENQHFNVVAMPSGTFLAFWTQASVENAPDQRVVASRSTDRGRTWSEPVEIDGPATRPARDTPVGNSRSSRPACCPASARGSTASTTRISA